MSDEKKTEADKTAMTDTKEAPTKPETRPEREAPSYRIRDWASI